jgi:hypothetical protein
MKKGWPQQGAANSDTNARDSLDLWGPLTEARIKCMSATVELSPGREAQEPKLSLS